MPFFDDHDAESTVKCCLLLSKLVTAAPRNLGMKQAHVVLATFGCGAMFSVLSSPLVPLNVLNIPIDHRLTAWHWTLTPSPSYVGQGQSYPAFLVAQPTCAFPSSVLFAGMIMGLRSGLSLALGAVLGWGIAGPVVHYLGANNMECFLGHGGDIVMTCTRDSSSIIGIQALAASAYYIESPAFCTPGSANNWTTIANAAVQELETICVGKHNCSWPYSGQLDVPDDTQTLRVQASCGDPGWAPGGVDDPAFGAKSWLLWVSLAIMLGDSFVSILSMAVKAFFGIIKGRLANAPIPPDDPCPPGQRVPTSWWSAGLLLSLAVQSTVLWWLFSDVGVTIMHTTLAGLFSLVCCVIAVRALGDTDLNPASGIAKLSQVPCLLLCVLIYDF